MKTRSVTNMLIFALVSTILLPSASLAEFQIVTVDINRILNETKESKQKKKELDKLSLAAKKKVEAKRDKLKELEKKIKSGAIKQDSAEAEKFRTEAKAFSRYVKDTEEDLRAKFVKSNKSLTSKVLKLVEEYAKKNKIDLVLDKSETVRGPVLFRAPSADITDSVIKSMNG